MSARRRASCARSSVLLAALLLGMAGSCGSRPRYPVCRSEPAEADVEAAKQAHSAAVRFFEKQAYLRAIDLWRAAYELDCTAHPLLINIAHAYENLGDEPAAREAYDLYVARAGPEADPAIVAKALGTVEPDAGASPDASSEPSAAPAGGSGSTQQPSAKPAGE